MKRIPYLLLTLLTLMLSCSKVELREVVEQDCEDVYCTFIWVSVRVKVTDSKGTPVALDRVKITRVSNGKDLSRSYTNEDWSAARRFGSYQLASDNDYEHLPRFKNTKLRFQGYIGSRQVINADYVVTFDCCHISLVSGKQELVVK